MKFADGQLEQHLSAGDGVLDIGANRGMVAATYANTVGLSGYVLAVEPNPEEYERLAHGLRKLQQAHTIQAAIGATVGETVIYPDGAQTSRWSKLTPHERPGVTVPMTTVDQVAPLVPKLRGIKVDVQGGEAEVLQGATETLRRHDVLWQVEIWPHGLSVAGSSVEAVCGQLQAAGLACLTRTWERVIEQCRGLKEHSYLDVVCRHAH